MFRIVPRSAAALVLAGGAAVGLAAPAFAGQGQAYSSPGFAGTNASCVGAAQDFGAHYGVNGDSFPTVVHGEVGLSVSSDAKTYGPGAVGDFNSSLAKDHGPIWTCVP